MDEAETDVLAYMSFPAQHRAKLHSTNPIERPIGEIKRRIEVVGIFPNEAAIVRLVGAILLEQNDEWAVQRARYITLGTRSSRYQRSRTHSLQRRNAGRNHIGVENENYAIRSRRGATPLTSGAFSS